ncbi:hypothetical protein [Deefgea sp. CFH1-16]
MAGIKQSGVPMLRFADLETDADLLELARDSAETILQHHVNLAQPHLDRWLPGREALLKV